MKYKVSELEGALLDAAVALAEGFPQAHIAGDGGGGRVCFLGPCRAEDSRFDWCPSTEWNQGGPIIERERIMLDAGEPWEARTQLRPVSGPHMAPCYAMEGPTPLIAAMRAYVASKLGDEVELP